MNYKIVLVIPVIFSLFLAGCNSDTQNLDIKQLDQQASNLRSHLYDISGNNDYYDNENIDFTLLKEVKDVVLDRSAKIVNSHRDDKIEDAVLDDGINKSITLLFFVWMEEFDAAQSNNDLDNLNYIKDEIDLFVNETEVMNWIKNNDKKSSLNEIDKILIEMPSLVNLGLEIDRNNEELNTMKSEADQFETNDNVVEYNRVADNYNVLLDENNVKIEDYNSRLEQMNYENIFTTFMKMIDVSYIFPGQTSIPLEK